ncbi:MAG: hypothetical protein IJW13_05490 [Clostridia bacterium]|nr:hypothetical protein [Clostridia bacterium]
MTILKPAQSKLQPQINDEEVKVKVEDADKKVNIKAPTLTLEQGLKVGAKVLSDCVSVVGGLFERYFANSSFGHTFVEVESDLHTYVQALLLDCAMSKENQNEQEFDFIYSLLDKADVFAQTSSIEQAKEKIKGILAKIPLAVLITVAVDVKLKTSETKNLISGIYSVYKLACILTESEIIQKERLFNCVINFAESQGVVVR